MKIAIAGLVFILAGCGMQPNYILVMTTFVVNGTAGGISTQTVIQGFASKEKCEFAGDQWYKSLGEHNINQFICLEPKP